jgi:GT2 family glycosyltransferase
MGEVAVALANWNGMKYIERCLESVFAQTCAPREVVVVDNGSTDGSPEWIAAHHTQIQLHLNPTNTGFAAGYNQAISACAQPFVLILNTDVFLAPDFIECALADLAEHPDAGAATGRVYQQGTGEWLNSGFFLRPQIRTQHSANLERAEAVFGCSGALILLRREMLEDIRIDGQYFDEGYFSYGEDIDLAWRAQLLGWQARFAPKACAHHVGSGSSAENLRFVDKPAFLQRHLLKNRYLTLVKNTSVGLLPYVLPAFVLAEPLVWLYLLLRLPWRFPYLLLALSDACRLLPTALRWRREIMRRQRVTPAHIRQFLRWV